MLQFPSYMLISKGFIIVETRKGGVDDITMMVKIKIHADNLHQDDIILTCKAVIPLIFNTLKNISFQERSMKGMYLTFMITFMLSSIT